MEASELPSPGKIVAKWLRRSSRIQNRHYDAAANLMRWHRWTGGLLVVLSVVEGSTLLVTLTKTTSLSQYEALVTGLLGLFVAVLAALQSFMSFESRADRHYAAGVKYGAIKRKLEAILSVDPSGQNAAAVLQEIGLEWDALTEESPPIPLSVWKRGEQNDKQQKE